MLYVASSLPDPLGGPPDFESENAHESDPQELAEGHDMAALGAVVGVESDETPIGGDLLLRPDEEGWGEDNIGRDIMEKWMAMGCELMAFQSNGGWWIAISILCEDI